MFLIVIAFDNNQILSQSGVRQLNLSEKESSGIIKKPDSKVSTPTKTQETIASTSMIETQMLEPPSVFNKVHVREDPEGEVQTKVKYICWCIPVREKIKIKNNIKENELQATLLQKKQE